MTKLYDTIVIGAGIIGSATAYHSAKSGKETLLLEQFPLPHTRGSSHGASRLIRKSHYPEFTPLAYTMWRTLENETGTTLLRTSGILTVTPSEERHLWQNAEKSLQKTGTPYQILTGLEINKKFPMLNFSPNDIGLYEGDGGILSADKCLQCFHDMLVKYGGELKDGEPVTEIIPNDVIIVHTSRAQYHARNVVITAGPWTNKVVKSLGLNLPLKARRSGVCYWKQKPGTKHGYTIEDDYPCVMAHGFSLGDYKINLYSTPSFEYPGYVKICPHSIYTIDPDARDLDENNDHEEQFGRFLEQHFPGVESKCGIRERCITTDTPDFEFILDRHPHHNNIIIGAGFSGGGFKMAPAVGKLLADMASNRDTGIDMRKFSLRRFKNVISTSKL